MSKKGKEIDLPPIHQEMPVLADPGYEGAGQGVLTPVKQPAEGSELDVDTRHASAERSLIGRAAARIKESLAGRTS
jgi:hypothetical protein